MAGIASIGPCDLTILREGEITPDVLGYMHNEDDVNFATESELIEHGAHGITGPVEVREGETTTTITAFLYLDYETMVKLAPHRVTDNGDGTFTVEGAIGKRVAPVKLHMHPQGNTDATGDFLFYRAFPTVKEQVVATANGKAKIEVSFKVGQDLTTKKIYDYGVALS